MFLTCWIMYVNSQKASHIANSAEMIKSHVFWYFHFSFFFNESFANVIDQLSSKLHENLSAAMKLRKHWLDTFTEANKHMFWNAVDRIVVQLREDKKFSKAEITVMRFVERQNLLQIQEIEILKVSATVLKCTANILATQEKELWVIKHCLKTLINHLILRNHCLSF